MKTALVASFRKQESINRTSWLDDNITEYKKQLPPYQWTQYNNQQSLKFINKITEAKKSMTPLAQQRKKKQ